MLRKPRRRLQPLRSYPDLRTWRFYQGLTQAEAAKHFGMAQSSWSRLENGQRKLGIERHALRRIMTETGVPIEALMGLSS